MSTTTHLMTADELIKLPRGQHRYELVKGELLTMSPSGGEHGHIVAKLTTRLVSYIETNHLGLSFGAETGFKLETDPDTVLAPDFGFIQNSRVSKLPKGYLEIAPDLAVEVISPRERKSKVAKKTFQWLSFGVRSVWLVRPETRTVETISLDGQKRLFGGTDILVDDVVPGFQLPLAEIFAGLEEQ